MKTHIKICGFTEPGRTRGGHRCRRGLREVGADPSPRQLSIAEAVRLRAYIPDTVQLVAVCGRPDLGTLQDIHRELKPDLIQLMADALPGPGHEAPPFPPSKTERISRNGFGTIARVGKKRAPLVLTDGPKPGSGILADWSRLHGLGTFTRLMIAGGLRPSNVGDAVRRLHPWGVDVSSGVESAPGVKSPDLVKDFVEAVRTAESSEERRYDWRLQCVWTSSATC